MNCWRFQTLRSASKSANGGAKGSTRSGTYISIPHKQHPHASSRWLLGSGGIPFPPTKWRIHKATEGKMKQKNGKGKHNYTIQSLWRQILEGQYNSFKNLHIRNTAHSRLSNNESHKSEKWTHWANISPGNHRSARASGRNCMKGASHIEQQKLRPATCM